MTTHFLVAGNEGSSVRVSRASKGAWLISVPLANGLQGTLPDISGTFGYPVEFTCLCSSIQSCACSHESIYNFWGSIADFLSYISDYARSNSLHLEGLRKRFVKFYVDLPVLELAQGNESDSPSEIRDGLIREANDLHSHSSAPHALLQWGSWPRDSSSEDDEVYSRLFANDIEVLSHIRISTERNSRTQNHSGDGLEHFYALVESTWTSATEILQAASVLDQINLIDISSHMLSYIRDVHGLSSDVDKSFLVRLNATLSDRNPMKWLFLPHGLNNPPSQDAPATEKLDKFRTKLSKLLLFKQRARRATHKEYSPVYASDTDDERIHGDPVGTYLEAKRHEHEIRTDTEPAQVIGHPRLTDSDSEYEVVAEFYGPLYHSRLPVARSWDQSPVCHDTSGPG